MNDLTHQLVETVCILQVRKVQVDTEKEAEIDLIHLGGIMKEGVVIVATDITEMVIAEDISQGITVGTIIAPLVLGGR